MGLKRKPNGEMTSRAKNNVEKFLKKHNFDSLKERKRRYGYEFICLCPFCKGGSDNEISFNINMDKGACRCWRASCNWRGSIEHFIRVYLGVPYPKAVDIVHGTGEATVESVEKNIDLLEQNLNKNIYETRESLLSEKKFESVDVWPDKDLGKVQNCSNESLKKEVENWLHKRNYTSNVFLDKHNLYLPEQEGKFRGRVLFEVNTEGNRAYQSYALYSDIEPKTLNPGGGILSQFIYYYDRLVDRDLSRLFITEGVFDAARILSWGFPAICGFGVYWSERQVSLLSNFSVDEICVTFDHIPKGNDQSTLPYELANQIDEVTFDTKVSVIEINEENYIGNDFEKGLDPDDLEKEEFINFWKHRKTLMNERELVNSKLNNLENQFQDFL